jgi:hypothetical protein
VGRRDPRGEATLAFSRRDLFTLGTWVKGLNRILQPLAFSLPLLVVDRKKPRREKNRERGDITKAHAILLMGLRIFLKNRTELLNLKIL